MTMRKLLMVLAAGALVGTPALAQKDNKAQPPAKPGDKAAQPTTPPGMTPEMAKMMAAMEAAGTPGEQHKAIQTNFAGEWDCVCKFKMDPKSPTWEESKGTTSAKMIFDGRYLKQQFKSDFGGQSFEGGGIFGYNNTTKKYESTWIDSMSTQQMFMTGTYDAAKKAYTFTGECADCTDPSFTMKKVRFVITVNSPDKHTEEMYSTGSDGKETKDMEMTYTRKTTTTDASSKN